MPATVVLHVHGESWSRRYQAASHAITAAAAGDRVLVVLWFEALRRFVRGGFDEGAPGEEAAARSRAEERGLPPPAVRREEARTLGATILAGETGGRLAGLDADEARARVDGLPGLQELLREAKDARLVLVV